MHDLFKNLFTKNQCQKSGICSTNPLLSAIEAVIINEIKQTAFYIIKLKEMNFTNLEITKEAIKALSVNISDINFNKNKVLAFFKNLKTMKKNVEAFYTKKANEINLSYEFITPNFSEKNEEFDLVDLIKSGENIIRGFYNTTEEEKLRLINLIVLICRINALKLYTLSKYKNVDFTYYYEVLRLLSLLNYKTTRKEKLIRRIREFSNIAYEIQKELNFELEKVYGKRKGRKISTHLYEGKSILISGPDLDELYNLLEQTKTEGINVYINPSMISAVFYPKFLEFPNFKGVFGTNDTEFNFSKFKGPIYITENSTQTLDSAFRGTIYTTKILPQDKTIQINKENLAPIIEEAKKLEGFNKTKKQEGFDFEYDLGIIQDLIEKNEGKNFLIYLGLNDNEIKEKFKDYIILNFLYPYETQGLYFALEKINSENLYVCFSECSFEIVNTIISIINKKVAKIYMPKCPASNINPHITDSLVLDFGIQKI